jgi:YidC/Oxa1 family membrane protein insertase
MDKNTLIGLGLIGAILVTFSLLNRPSEEELLKQRQAAQQTEQSAGAETASTTEELPQLPEGWVYQTKDGKASKNAEGLFLISDTLRQVDSVWAAPKKAEKEKKSVSESKPVTAFASRYMHEEGQTFTLENDLIKVEILEKGGRIGNVFLKKYRTYEAFNGQTEEPLQLVESTQSYAELQFDYEGSKVRTKNLRFEAVENKDNAVRMRLALNDNQYIDAIYSLEKGSYHVNFAIEVHGFGKTLNADQIAFNWQANLLRTEKSGSQERMVSTVFFHNEKGYDYLSEASYDNETTETPTNWVAFKQSYFSAILIPEKAFAPGANLSIKPFDKADAKEREFIKQYGATLPLSLASTENGRVDFRWYFGPNDYKLLKTYENDMEDIVNLGWGIFRWVNVYGIQPIFVWLIKIGMGAGIAILILTLIVKVLLAPVSWKMYVSSAKMRILRPQIEALNAKYPKQEDAMKKQMEMMALYRESGASPLSGCLPMLLQMPILFAVFRFFPSSFDLRQKGFLWAEDLSSYDAIVSWETYVPFLSDIYGNHISLFTLLMAGTTLFYTHINSANMQQPSQPGMPNMKVIMYIFPIMMIFFFNGYSSGLSYYYFISTLTSILIMIAIKEFFVDEEKLKAKMEAQQAKNASGNGKKKSKFQERLEAMQQAQRDKMNKR